MLFFRAQSTKACRRPLPSNDLFPVREINESLNNFEHPYFLAIWGQDYLNANVGDEAVIISKKINRFYVIGSALENWTCLLCIFLLIFYRSYVLYYKYIYSCGKIFLPLLAPTGFLGGRVGAWIEVNNPKRWWEWWWVLTWSTDSAHAQSFQDPTCGSVTKWRHDPFFFPIDIVWMSSLFSTVYLWRLFFTPCFF